MERKFDESKGTKGLVTLEMSQSEWTTLGQTTSGGAVGVGTSDA